MILVLLLCDNTGTDSYSWPNLNMFLFKGVLRIHLVQAQNLMKKDISMLGKFKLILFL